MRVIRPSLIFVLFLGFVVFHLLIGGVILARADESASPEPSPTTTSPTPSPSPSAEAPNPHTWAKHWAKQAATNRRALKPLSRCLDRPLPKLLKRPGADASDRAWNRYGQHCKVKAVRFVKIKARWATAWKRIQADPVALGKVMAKRLYGWTGPEWTALYRLWSAESGWRVHAANPSSSAYGIPQALPGSKMGPGWRHSALVQIRWGLRYIKARYLTPSRAYAHLCACNWY